MGLPTPRAGHASLAPSTGAVPAAGAGMARPGSPAGGRPAPGEPWPVVPGTAAPGRGAAAGPGPSAASARARASGDTLTRSVDGRGSGRRGSPGRVWRGRGRGGGIAATVGAEQHALPLQRGFREQARQGALRREQGIDG